MTNNDITASDYLPECSGTVREINEAEYESDAIFAAATYAFEKAQEEGFLDAETLGNYLGRLRRNGARFSEKKALDRALRLAEVEGGV